MHASTSAIDLLAPVQIDTASGDIGRQQMSTTCKAVWTTPLPTEIDAPANRIIHSRILQLSHPIKLNRLGLRKGLGYHKCGSEHHDDWITAFRLLVWNGATWDQMLYEHDIREPEPGEIIWYDLGDVEARSVIIEARECFIDKYWTGWNIVSEAFLLEGSRPDAPIKRKENRFAVEKIDINNLPYGVSARIGDGEVRFKTPFIEVGFILGKTGFSYFSIDDGGNGRTDHNLLRSQPGMNLQGLRLHPVGMPAFSALFLRYVIKGKTYVIGNAIRYEIEIPDIGQRYVLNWTVHIDRISLEAIRMGEQDVRAWESSIWYSSFHSEMSATSTIAPILRKGEVGLTALPSLLHMPNFGTLRLTSESPNLMMRSDSFRPFRMTAIEIKLGERAEPEGDYTLLKGTFTGKMEITARPHIIPLKPDTPPIIRKAVMNSVVTSLPYRPDTATLSNNGNSMHCPLCMDNWSGLATQIGELLPGFHSMELVRESLQRWLDIAPGYASGPMLDSRGYHLAEDEYIMTGTAAFLGMADFLDVLGTEKWLRDFAPQIRKQLDLMKGRDVDGDGLVESTYRTGVSGSGDWSTCWFDVISFGWKCAFSNALLYEALTRLPEQFRRLGQPDLAIGLEDWAAKLKSVYLPTFFNEETGWLAGWRCKDDKLHDYAFIFVNGCVVNTPGLIEPKLARSMMEKLWHETKRVGLPSYRLGLPGNLWKVPDYDMVSIMHGVSMGYYANGGLTLSQSRHFVKGLYTVGMDEEGNAMLHGLCESLADGSAFSGLNTGVDWRFWDGWPCGYEGLLADQFGILITALERYKR